jgi:hypothetical protein
MVGLLGHDPSGARVGLRGSRLAEVTRCPREKGEQPPGDDVEVPGLVKMLTSATEEFGGSPILSTTLESWLWHVFDEAAGGGFSR